MTSAKWKVEIAERPAQIPRGEKASTNKKVTEVCQKVLCGIYAAKIIQLVARSKFT